MGLDGRYIFNENNIKYVIIKIGNENALTNMKNGNWRFQHSAQFQKDYRDYNDIGRADNEDSVVYEQTSVSIPMIVKVGEKDATGIPEDIKIVCKTAMDDDSARIICFYQLSVGENGELGPIDERMKDFGEKFVFIDLKHALRKIRDVISNELCAIVRDFKIEYYNSNYNGVVGNDKKREEYSYQNERRIRIDCISNVRDINNDKEVKKKESQMRDLINEQEKYAAKYRKEHYECRKYKYREKALNANREYERVRREYLAQKATHCADYLITDCTSELYNVDDLISARKKISDY